MGTLFAQLAPQIRFHGKPYGGKLVALILIPICEVFHCLKEKIKEGKKQFVIPVS
jgi:hypothetical protein